MKQRLLSAALSFGLLGAAFAAPARANDELGDGHKIKHVLLISVDGLHALDVANYVKNHPGSALAELSEHAITYSNARTPANSDSFPGLLALLTGGSPISHGLFYDVSYDRNIFDPTDTTCSRGPGNMMVFDESIDLYNAANVSQNVIDPSKLPRHLNAQNQCVALFPHEAMRSNTLFEVVKSHDGRTAWADKHPAYDIVNGPSGKGVDDLFTPEITNVGGLDNTHSVVCTVRNDDLKVQAIINEIHGRRHDGSPAHGMPTVFGMNFQAVSVGQKLVTDNFDGSCPNDQLTNALGGYKSGDGTPSEVLSYGLRKTDEALGRMVKALKEEGKYDSTLFIVSAKHGQSPINPAEINKPGHFADLVAAVAAQTNTSNDPGVVALEAAAGCSIGPCGFVQDDDIALIWLPDQSTTGAVASYLNAHAPALFIEEVLSGAEIKLRFRNPLKDSRTPDILVQPVYGTIYTGSTTKNAEHGGFSFGDTNVGLIVANPGLDAHVVKTPVVTSQVAVSILKALGIDPNELKAVRNEGTQVLPFLFTDGDSDDE